MTFEQVFKAHYANVVRYIMRTIKNQEVAEDLAQEVFIQLYKTNWEEIAYLNAWLMKSAVYVTYNYMRSEKRHQARIEKEALHIEVADGESLEDRWIRKEEVEQVHQAMEQLQAQDQKLLMLRYSGMKYKEIGEVLGVDTGAIGTMLVRAQNKFKKLYEKHGEGKQ